ncbi:acyclic terpene utilization AtuA family protein [Methylocapsa sp. S129]|uniref:acyclic terpene utilization AtuA family protein n=1 Tax=Methylocapsa sp. S129 TaxID=1641869 RepID=UPI00131D3F32|nr:acyclic terpene utilization AtuA family protein [Methylocapsa sp. S129]
MRRIRLGAGAGFSGDRIEPAVELAERGALDYLIFECLAERTIALAQQARRADPSLGYDPLLEARMRAILPICAAKGVKIISNMGAANPLGAARRIAEIAAECGCRGLRIAAVTGDDVLELMRARNAEMEETGGRIADLGDRIISANAYLGAEPIVSALAQGADVVVTGRSSDPALFLAPLLHEFGWRRDDWRLLGQGALAGHLLECAGQVSGGYFADPGFKETPDLARLGFPIGEISADGDLVLSKIEGSGGRITEATCKEQLLYEIHDPARYIQPDVVADFSQATVREIGPDRVRVAGGRGSPRPDALKVSIGYLDGYIGEGQISYAGAGALARGRLAIDIVRERLAQTQVAATELRFEIIGLNALHGDRLSRDAHEPYEVRVRVAGHALSRQEAARIGAEVETLYTNGPAAGGGVVKSTREVIAVASAYAPREAVRPSVSFEVAR